MTLASTFKPFDREKVFCDLETWDALFHDAVKNNPAAADSLARLLYYIIQNIGEGRKGIERTVNTMKLGVEWAYRYTDAHHVSFHAFLYDLQDLMLIGDDPSELLKSAIHRANAANSLSEAEQARKRRTGKSRPRGKAHRKFANCSRDSL